MHDLPVRGVQCRHHKKKSTILYLRHLNQVDQHIDENTHATDGSAASHNYCARVSDRKSKSLSSLWAGGGHDAPRVSR